MDFSKLANYFNELEGTSKRKELTSILARLFSETSAGEVRIIAYLVQGLIAPPFKRVILGVAERMLEDSISEAFGKEKSDVVKAFKKAGDLGLVAESYAKKSASGLSIKKIHESLVKVAGLSGAGSASGKVKAIAGVLKDLSGLEARYFCRAIQGKLRLGVGDMTVLDGLSAARKSSDREALEGAYDLCSDLGLVAETYLRKGLSGVKRIHVILGNPIRSAIAERLRNAEDIIHKLGRCAVEVKYDGFRCQVHKDGNEVRVFSRNLEETTSMLPELVSAARKQVKADKAILDGEALVYDARTKTYKPFQETIQRKRKHGVKEAMEALPLHLFVFDLLYLNGKDLTGVGYESRSSTLRKLIKSGDVIHATDRIITESPKELMKFFNTSIKSGFEGIIAKKLSAPYSAGKRDFNWVKLKKSYEKAISDTVDAVIVGYLRGRGKRAKFGIGALLFAVYDEEKEVFVTIAKVGSGLSDEDWVRVRKLLDASARKSVPNNVKSEIKADVWVSPELVFALTADEITKSPVHTAGYALRFPRITGWVREDKRAQDATTLKEIKELFRAQGRKRK